MRTLGILLALPLLVLLLVPRGGPPLPHAEHTVFEDYHEAVGALEDGVLRASLEVRPALWSPWGETGPALSIHALAVPGEAARMPGPMIRVTVGTPVEVELRNTLADTLMVRGLRDRAGLIPPDMPEGPAFATLPFVGDSVVVPPGERVTVRFTPGAAGSFVWFGKTFQGPWSDTPQPLFGAGARDRGIVGLILVEEADDPPHPDERIFLVTHWADVEAPDTFLPAARFFLNGRAWPHTERLHVNQGDTVRWRVINQSGTFHPMHLHGFYFTVDSWTSQGGTSLMPPGLVEPEAVTWPLQILAAIQMRWVAEEPGNWVFHCHLMRHMSWVQAPGAWGEGTEGKMEGSAGGGGHPPADAAGVDLLGGMVLGVTVFPAPGWAPATEVPRRHLRLHIGLRQGVFGDAPGYGFVLEEGGVPPAPDSVHFPGSLIVLERGEATEILVLNHADVPLGVHWHGLELESWADGVPGWSGGPGWGGMPGARGGWEGAAEGDAGGIVSAIAPGDSLAVRMTPPRAGTFMYHVHSEPGHQLAQGLHGPFLVVEPGAPHDPGRDRIFLMGALGVGDDPAPALNGMHAPPDEFFRAGETYRLRFMQISPDENKVLRLLGENGEPVTWRRVARDGWDLPEPARTPFPAFLRFFDVGTTLDLEWTPATPGRYVLEIVTEFDQGLAAFPRPAADPHRMEVGFVVR